MKHRSTFGVIASVALALFGVFAAADGQAGITCQREVSADVVVIDQPLMFNRLGAGNPNGKIFALRRDVIFSADKVPLTVNPGALNPTDPLQLYELRPDRRPRPMVLRVRKGDCLTVNLQNLLKPAANPRDFPAVNGPPDLVTAAQTFTVPLDEQPVDRWVGFHAAGLQVVTGIYDDGSIVGNNLVLENPATHEGGLVSPGNWTRYKLYAEKEGVFLVTSEAVLVGSDGNEGHISNGLFGQVIVEPTGAAIYRGQTVEEELRLATTGYTADGHPIINYEAVYPGTPSATNTCAADDVWCQEGKAGLPILNMMRPTGTSTGAVPNVEIVHSEIHSVNAYAANAGAAYQLDPASPKFPANTYPLESVGKRNPTVPNRLEPFRDFASVFHDETANGQAFPCFYNKNPFNPQCGGVVGVGGAPVQFGYTLEGVKDAFMINYGSGGIGSEIIANRLNVGPMHDCLDCAYEEFFLTSFTVGDPAMLVDIPANQGLEFLRPGDPVPPGTQGPKATHAIGAEDPSNIHHSYTGDFVKIRNTHVGKEQHVFHLHNHQWLYNPNDDNSNYLDAQGIGPGAGFTYEINFGGSGNRNKSTGDSIFHCHFYPHFAQGMWYHWRHNDTFSAGTILAATPNVPDAPAVANPACAVAPAAGDVTCLDGTGATVNAFLAPVPGTFAAVATGYHATPWALADTTPAAGARAYPDPEIATGTPIPAVVPLPGKPMAPMPGRATVVANPLFSPFKPGVPVGSLAKVIDRNIHPGFPFFVAGMEDVIGQRPPTPPLDMLNAAQASLLLNANPLFRTIVPAQADGWDGGLPRHALQGYAAGGTVEHNVVDPKDFSKTMATAKPVYYPEGGTDLEQQAMAYHAQKFHDTFLPNGTAVTGTAGFRTNGGGGPVVGAPFHNPCIDDDGRVLDPGVVGNFFSGESGSAAADLKSNRGSSVFNNTNPRIYKGTFLQFDAVLNKVGYHFPQERIVALWQDAGPIIAKQKPPEPMVFRFNTFDCMVYHNSNLVPEAYEMDDYQVRTPTDIIGQHIHLPKWDLTTTDGAANGWNYEDGTLSPGAVRERIAAINAFMAIPGNAPAAGTGASALLDPTFSVPTILTAQPHPYFGAVAAKLGGRFPEEWLGARTTIERWFADPVVNTEGVDRGLGIIFTHDHYGPSTHQQIGLYSTALVEPAGSKWVHNETGQQLGYDPKTGVPAVDNTLAALTARPPVSIFPTGTAGAWPLVTASASGLPANPNCTKAGARCDGGPTSWQAQIQPPATPPDSSTVKSETVKAFREFYFEFSDFQHAYEAGVYVGAGQDGLPLVGTGPGAPPVVSNAGNAQFAAIGGNAANAFRFAINPPLREQNNTAAGTPNFAEIVRELPGDPNRCPVRPCPQAIDVQDPGVLVVNYRHEPVGLRIYDPNLIGPDGKPGRQALGKPGDLAYALQSRTDRKIAALNVQPAAGANINGTLFPPRINNGGVGAGDPFTPMLRAYMGDIIKVKMQAGGHEEEHNAMMHGMKWLQAGSGHGRAPNSGWRNGQAAGISEQFTLNMPVTPLVGGSKTADYTYSVDASHDGWWSGMWGIIRTYDSFRQSGNLIALPGSVVSSTNDLKLTTAALNGFNGACPTTAPKRFYDVTAVLANDALSNPGLFIPVRGAGNPVADNVVGASLKALRANGTPAGSLVYNPRPQPVAGTIIPDAGPPVVINHTGPLHDPTAILYIRTEDLIALGQGTLTTAQLNLVGGVCIVKNTVDNTFSIKTTCPVQPACFGGSAKSGFKFDRSQAGCPVELKPGAPVEPLVLRAAAGECVIVTLRNKLPAGDMPELATYSTIQGVVKRDRLDPLGSTTFGMNLFDSSNEVGLHPQMVAHDVTRDDGVIVGQNPVGPQTVGPGPGVVKYRWYMGDISGKPNAANTAFDLFATPVEFGGANLGPADKVKQGAKSLVGALVVEPAGSTWPGSAVNLNSGGNDPGDLALLVDTQNDRQSGTGTRKTRAQTTVTAPAGAAGSGGTFRDFSLVLTKGLTQYYADGTPVEHMNGEGVGIPEDAQESSGMALNYGSEPLWFRFGIPPQSPFGNAGTAGAAYGNIPNSHMAYSNTLTGGQDPATPVFKANAGQPARLRITNPYGTSRGSTFALHGHVWQRDPYVCPTESQDGLTGKCNNAHDNLGGPSGGVLEANGRPIVGSKAIGNNPIGFAQSGQESWTPYSHFDIVLPSAGGGAGTAGDYLFRDKASFGNASGVWGILRVQ